MLSGPPEIPSPNRASPSKAWIRPRSARNRATRSGAIDSIIADSLLAFGIGLALRHQGREGPGDLVGIFCLQHFIGLACLFGERRLTLHQGLRHIDIALRRTLAGL